MTVSFKAIAVFVCTLLSVALSCVAETPVGAQFDIRSLDENWSVEAQQVLLSSQIAFDRTFAGAGFDLRPFEQPLMCIGFADRDAFNRYARSVDGVDMSWSDGYYSARTNRIALIYRDGGEAHNRQHNHADGDTHSVVGGFNWKAKLAHEATHQFAFNRGVQKRGVMYPLWASEGLAGYLESCIEQPADQLGMNPHRRADMVDVAARGALLPLSELLTMTRVPRKAQAISDVYAQSWAWFHFAITQEPRALRRYYAALAELPKGSRSRGTLRREVVAAFGPIDQLEARWAAHVQQLVK